MSELRKTRKHLKKLSEFLTIAKKLDEKELKYLFQHIDTEILLLIFDAIHNCVNKDCAFFDTEQQLTLKEPLGKYKSEIRYITSPSKSIVGRRKKLVQFGKGFPIIASLLLPVLTQLLS